jgi:hypothetical protein
MVGSTPQTTSNIMTTEYIIIEGSKHNFTQKLREAVAEGYTPYSQHTATYTGSSTNLWYSLMLMRVPSTKPDNTPY